MNLQHMSVGELKQLIINASRLVDKKSYRKVACWVYLADGKEVKIFHAHEYGLALSFMAEHASDNQFSKLELKEDYRAECELAQKHVDI